MEQTFKKYLVLLVSCIAAIMAYISLMSKWEAEPLRLSDRTIRMRTSSVVPQPVFQRKCSPVNNLVFIKTYKTGSTTVSSIFNRYGERHNMSLLVNKDDATRGHFRAELADDQHILPPLGVHIGDYKNYKNYNLMSFHIIFLKNEDNLKRLMSPDARYITILRDPVKQWESAFFFFHGNTTMMIPGVKPIQQINNFLKHSFKYWGNVKRDKTRTQYRNGQWVDFLGSSRPINDNMTNVKELIKKLDEKLQLVLITDYIDESLVLLKRLLCWDFEDLLYVKMNQRPSHSSVVINEYQRNKIREWNQADMMLYDHYNQTLWRRIAEIGPNFYKDLVTFRKMLNDYGQWCNITIINTKIRKVPSSENSTEFCQRLVADRTTYVKVMMDRQINQKLKPLSLTGVRDVGKIIKKALQ